jgi:micrococcal nuclease
MANQQDWKPPLRSVPRPGGRPPGVRPRRGYLAWILLFLLAIGIGLAIADRTLLWREEYGLTAIKRPLAKPTLLPIKLGATYTVKVIRVLDGDTIDVQWTDGAKARIRLTDIDAPESCQPFGPESTQALERYVLRKSVEVEVLDLDRDQRVIGRVFVEGRDISAALVRDGAAWFYEQYARDPSLYDLEIEARDAGRGLWSLPLADRVEPREFRQQVRCPTRR